MIDIYTGYTHFVDTHHMSDTIEGECTVRHDSIEEERTGRRRETAESDNEARKIQKTESNSSSTASSRTSSPSRPKRYICDVEGCGKAYNRPSLLEQHIRTHSNERPYVCMVIGCDQSFTRKDHLERHILKHTDEEEKPLHCSICGKGVNTVQHLKRHERTHFPTFECNYEGCIEKFYKHQSLKAHINSEHLSDRFKCKECGKVFPRPSRLSDHMDRTHANPTKFTCDFPTCAQSFKTWSALQLHTRTEHPKLECSVCGKKCLGTTGLNNHMKIHNESTIIKLWKCQACNYSYLKKDDLIKHYQELHLSFEIPSELLKPPVVTVASAVKTEDDNVSDTESVPQPETPPTSIVHLAETRTPMNNVVVPLSEYEIPVSNASVKLSTTNLLRPGSPSTLQLLLSNVDEKRIPCSFSSKCTRKFKKEYDLKRHVEWHKRVSDEIDSKLERLRREKKEADAKVQALTASSSPTKLDLN